MPNLLEDKYYVHCLILNLFLTTSGNHTLVSRRSQTPSVVLGGGGFVWKEEKSCSSPFFSARSPPLRFSPFHCELQKKSTCGKSN